MGQKLVLVHVEIDLETNEIRAECGADMLRALGAIEYAKAMVMTRQVMPSLQPRILPGMIPLPPETGRA